MFVDTFKSALAWSIRTAINPAPPTKYGLRVYSTRCFGRVTVTFPVKVVTLLPRTFPAPAALAEGKNRDRLEKSASIPRKFPISAPSTPQLILPTLPDACGAGKTAF